MTTRDSELTALTVAQLRRRIQQRSVSPVEVTDAFLRRTEALEPRVGAFITLTAERAMDAARAAERAIVAGHHRGPLHGIPVAVKDLFWTAGVRTTSGSAIDANFIPDTDATAVARLQEAGAYSTGKTNMTEYAFDPTGRNAHYGAPHNPWKHGHMTGGSSSGSAAAVAAGFVPLALGSDTGGSIRLPSALCGLTGLKPTFGLVSRSGVTPLSWSLDHAGPMARTAQDCAIALNAIAGHDPADPYSASAARHDYVRELDGGIRGLRIGVPRAYVDELLMPEVAAAFDEALRDLAALGASVEEVSVPEIGWSSAIGIAIINTEAASLHAQNLRMRPQHFDPAVRVRLESARFLPAPAYLEARRARVLLIGAFQQAMRRVDVIATPTTWMTAPLQSQRTVTANGEEQPIRDTFNRMLRTFNITGMPAVSLPCGFSTDGLPIGMQLAGRHFEDGLVLRVAHAFQQATDWHTRDAPVIGPAAA